jgi:uncharacterized membrane protein YdjX (TVP38/TMEM64 family)
MAYIIDIVAVLIFVNVGLKMSFWRWWQALLFGLVCGGFLAATYPYAIEQTKTQMAAWMNSRELMQNLAVLVTFESIVCVLYCFSAMRALYGASRRKWKHQWLSAYPCLLVFPALFYLLTEAVFRLPGVGFEAIAYGLSAGVCLGLPALSLLLSRLLPEQELRLELHFLFSLLICVTALLMVES